MTDLHRLTATEASALIAKREISSEELVRACIARIREREPVVQAWAHFDESIPLAAARAADAKKPEHPLHGIPFGVKDVIDSAELPTEYGSTIHKGHRPAHDAMCIQRMKEAGAIFMGKTVSTEFATHRPGKTRNPHNPNHTPGGSSSGSAAAVGDCMVPLAFGNQTAGSHIRPGSYNGICALKPTWGTVDLTGIMALEHSYDTLGYYARSFDDIATYYATVRRVPAAPLADGIGRPPRIGFYRTMERKFAEPASVAAVEAAAKKLESLGAIVEEMDLPIDFADLAANHALVLNVGLSKSLANEYLNHRTEISEQLRGMIESGLATDAATWHAAIDHADQCRSRINEVIGTCDAVLCPSAPGEAPEGLTTTGNPVFQIVWTLLHVPCVNVPGRTGPKGLPVGVQLVGKQYGDARLLALAKWFHRAWSKDAG